MVRTVSCGWGGEDEGGAMGEGGRAGTDGGGR